MVADIHPDCRRTRQPCDRCLLLTGHGKHSVRIDQNRYEPHLTQMAQRRTNGCHSFRQPQAHRAWRRRSAGGGRSVAARSSQSSRLTPRRAFGATLSDGQEKRRAMVREWLRSAEWSPERGIFGAINSPCLACPSECSAGAAYRNDVLGNTWADITTARRRRNAAEQSQSLRRGSARKGEHAGAPA
jgi:hypothetical protein